MCSAGEARGAAQPSLALCFLTITHGLCPLSASPHIPVLVQVLALQRMVQQQQAGTRVPRLLEQWVKKLKCSGSSGIGLESFPDIRLVELLIDIHTDDSNLHIEKALH